MQVIHGKKGTLKKRKFKQPNLGSFLQKEGMTDHFWTFGARVDGQEGGELMKPLTIVKGTSDDTNANVQRSE